MASSAISVEAGEVLDLSNFRLLAQRWPASWDCLAQNTLMSAALEVHPLGFILSQGLIILI